MKRLAWLLGFMMFSHNIVLAHQTSATYVANEAVLITNGDKKVLFDPFFHQVFGTYQLVPEDVRQAIFAGTAPFDNLTAIVISHAHGDHFSAADVLQYLQRYPATKLIAPAQAVDELNTLDGYEKVISQITAVKLAFNEMPIKLELADLIVEAVRIPHAGWPSRADIENIVFRITLKDQKYKPITVMHMGDADANDDHYLPYKTHWKSRQTDTAFPPYWFYFSAEGNDILNEIINAQQSVGIHVPVDVPNRLKSTGADYFSKPGEIRNLDTLHKH